MPAKLPMQTNSLALGEALRLKPDKPRAPRNRTLTLMENERQRYRQRLLKLNGQAGVLELIDKTIHQDLLACVDYFPSECVDLLFIDPPYNRNKLFNQVAFSQKTMADYETWFRSWLTKLIRLLKPTASIYICCDWQSSTPIHRVIDQYFMVRNRITWEREKGRGAKYNWKNCSEDIWFCTVSNQYTFNLDTVKLKRKVIAPYRDKKGNPKDWQDTRQGKFRITHPSNLWTDISVPFWSMPENTDHPTQKPEKLAAKLILASSREGDIIFDPFLGSGTTSVVAKKLNRRYIGVEVDELYCCLAEKRLELANHNKTIQGYADGYFWERNTFAYQK
ncbi:MAG: site-specific DNA-methyltransferase [Leptolyngbyaceae cyanobacterium MO_188.B28]|nr:site-specific DNA-methyltransferase [Leptolyngbyaceae cyanobacterium MO_188.B28]